MDFVGVDDSGNVRVGNLVSGESPPLLLGTGLSVGSEDVVEFLEGAFGPDNESADMTSRGELEKVQSANMSNLNSRDVSQSLDEGNIGSAVDDQGSSSAAISSVSELSSSSSDLD